MITTVARVQKVITDKELHKKYYNIYGQEDSIGGILFSKIDNPTSPDGNTDNLPFARPLYKHMLRYPIPGEIVNIVNLPGSNYNEEGKNILFYLPSISLQGIPSSNDLPDILNEDGIFPSLTEYFDPPIGVNALLPYEGDSIIEGRFGQSIRFSSTVDNAKVSNPNKWSNEGPIGNPITIIKNGQAFDPEKNNGDHILEDINNDNSSIYMCSNQQISNFIPASFYDESYGQDIFKESKKDEPNIANDVMNEDIKEDVVLKTPSNIPAEELQVINEPIPIKETEYAANDIAETEEQSIGSNDTLGALPSNYNSGNISQAELTQTFV